MTCHSRQAYKTRGGLGFRVVVLSWRVSLACFRVSCRCHSSSHLPYVVRSCVPPCAPTFLLWCGAFFFSCILAPSHFVCPPSPPNFTSKNRCDPEELVEILETVNPANKAGKVTLITRMSSKYLDEHLPKLILAVQKAGLNVSYSLKKKSCLAVFFFSLLSERIGC